MEETSFGVQGILFQGDAAEKSWYPPSHQQESSRKWKSREVAEPRRLHLSRRRRGAAQGLASSIQAVPGGTLSRKRAGARGWFSCQLRKWNSIRLASRWRISMRSTL